MQCQTNITTTICTVMNSEDADVSVNLSHGQHVTCTNTMVTELWRNRAKVRVRVGVKFGIKVIQVIMNQHVKHLLSQSKRRQQDNSPTNQLTVSQVAGWSTRGLVNSSKCLI